MENTLRSAAVPDLASELGWFCRHFLQLKMAAAHPPTDAHMHTRMCMSTHLLACIVTHRACFVPVVQEIKELGGQALVDAPVSDIYQSAEGVMVLTHDPDQE